MTTGAEHYAAAERLLERADAVVSENMAFTTGEHKADVLAAAQVHATLAHAAATAGEWVWPAGGSRASRQWAPLLDPAKTDAASA